MLANDNGLWTRQSGASTNKRSFDVFKAGTPLKPNQSGFRSTRGFESAPRNQLLAGYLAHEYLARGTLFGERWDPTVSESADPADTKRMKPSKKAAERKSKSEAANVEKNHRYIDVARLLKLDWAHIPGIFNPTQLARFLQV